MGSSRSTPTSSTVQQVRQEYPAYFQPYLEDVLEGAQQQYQREYEPFPESRLVDTPESRTDALTALQDMDLARMSQGVYNDAISGTQAAGTGFPDTNLESYMNPYQQLVTDQLLRNATERRGVARKGIGDAAARSGAYGGSRQGVAEAMFDRDTQRELTDLEERSNMAAFQNALAASQADKQRQLASSAQLGQLGQAQQQALTSGIAGVEKAATAEQALAQQARDIALQDFKSQEGFDTQKLAEYSAIIRGATPPPNQFIDKTTSTPQSGLQQLGGIASLGAGLFGMGKAKGGPVEYAAGGTTYARGGDVTQDVVTDAIDKLAGIGMGNITMPTPGMDALHAHPAIASTTIESISMPIEEEQVTDVMDIDSMTGLQGLGQAPAVDDFDMDSAREVTTDEMDETMTDETMMRSYTGGPIGLAYGGVPGQAYTEDIGMMGGLASVAGPQMRFNEGKGVPSDALAASTAYADRVREQRKRKALELKNRMGLQQQISELNRENIGQTLSKAFPLPMDRRDPTEEASAKALREKKLSEKIGAAQPLDSARGLPGDFQPEAFGDIETISDIEIDEMGYSNRADDVVFGQMEMETKLSPDVALATGKKEHAKKEKEAGYKIPISNQQLIAIGLQLLSGRESGLEAAGKSLAGSKSQEEILAEKANKESLARRRDAQSAYEFTKEQRETLEGIAKDKISRAKLKVDIAKLKSDMANNNGKLAVSRFKNTPDFYKIAPLADAAGKEYTDDELEELTSNEKIAAVRRSINKISPGYFPVTKKAATGGTIPNTLSKLGISSIRKV
tara:strand:+ start:30150 stop:32531 length:2382 start_codon:yes stop_codon:yes gene_type:complete